jgi:hypoxanthine-DNA glycosylase
MPHEASHIATDDEGFPPLVGRDPAVLILGSLPGKKSIIEQEYYAHPQNTFWKIMGELFGARPGLPYTERVTRLTNRRIAVWDVLQSSARPGSLDSSIRLQSAKCNDFPTFLRRHSGIGSICFNGKKAADLFTRLAAGEVLRQYPQLQLQTLPSTSPAHAAMPFAEKLKRWSFVKVAVERAAH